MTLDFADPVRTGGASRHADPLFNAHYLTIMRLCMRQLGDRTDAEDATQETFRRALQQRDRVVGDPLPWLLTVARNVCVDELRRRSSGRTASERMAAVRGCEEPDEKLHSNPEHIVVGRMFVGDLLGRLTPAERRVVAGRVLGGESGDQAAAAMGVTASTTRVLLARARGKLRRYLAEEPGLMAGILVAGRRTSMNLRRRLLGRSWTLQGSAEMLLPALVVSALTAGTLGPATAATSTAAAAIPQALAAERLDVSRSVATTAGASTGAWRTSASTGTTAAAASPSGSPQRPGSPLASLLPPPDPNQVGVTDFEPSPTYQSDHTIFMVGSGDCLARCFQLFRSSDGGATWSYVPASQLQSSQLLLPESNRSLTHFYAAGNGVLQVTNDGGASFHDIAPAPGITTVAPAWLGAQVVEADVALSFIGSSQVPQVAAVYGPADSAAGAPLLLPAAGGFAALQVVQNQVLGGDDSLMRCTASGCAVTSQLPLSGLVQLIASPGFTTDHTLVAIGGGVAVSHDEGRTFHLASPEALSEATFVTGPAAPRLVGVDHVGAGRSEAVLVFSDDLGRTWQRAGVDPSARVGTSAHSPRVLRPGRIIAWAGDATAPGHNVFVCSADGARWSTCAPDRG
jgi:RNA polymerase sigma-70 factor (ECF subfamily)